MLCISLVYHLRTVQRFAKHPLTFRLSKDEYHSHLGDIRKLDETPHRSFHLTTVYVPAYFQVSSMVRRNAAVQLLQSSFEAFAFSRRLQETTAIQSRGSERQGEHSVTSA